MASEKYLGAVIHKRCTLGEQKFLAATAACGALYVWLWILRTLWLVVTAKMAVLLTCSAPCIWYGIELCQVTGRKVSIEVVVMRVSRAIAGTCASAAMPAYVRRHCFFHGVCLEVLLSDLGILPARDMSRLAHAAPGAHILVQC